MAHSVVLNWIASPDTVDGYNIYRGTAAGAETTKLNSAPVAGTAFTDSSPLQGNDFYVAKSVIGGVESVVSNEVSTVILPAPPTGLVVKSSS